jgi:hypothetical protein
MVWEILTNTKVFIIGNGESRQGIDLNGLKTYGPVFGCNALYREFEPDYLISVDRPMTEEINHSGYAKKHKVYVRYIDSCPDGVKLWDFINARMGWAAGPCAMELAAQPFKMGFNQPTFYIIGFDLYGIGGKINNIFKGTSNYKTSEKTEITCKNWIKQLDESFRENENIIFKKVGDMKDERPEIWNDIPNLHYISIEEMNKELSDGNK